MLLESPHELSLAQVRLVQIVVLDLRRHKQIRGQVYPYLVHWVVIDNAVSEKRSASLHERGLRLLPVRVEALNCGPLEYQLQASILVVLPGIEGLMHDAHKDFEIFSHVVDRRIRSANNWIFLQVINSDLIHSRTGIDQKLKLGRVGLHWSLV